MEYLGLTLDKFQEDAIIALEEGKSVVVSAPTGSGKTLIANYLIDLKLKRGEKVVYTAPIKALSNQKFREFTSLYGAHKVGLLTGDVVINPLAPVLIMTTEIYRNMVMVKDPSVLDVFAVIFDEVHFINDIERGYVWEESIIFSPPQVRFLCLSATIPNAEEFSDWIGSIKEHLVATIQHDFRVVPLTHKFFDIETGIADLKAINELAEIPSYDHVVRGRGKRKPRSPPPDHTQLVKELRDNVPCLFFAFSRGGCEKRALELVRKQYFPYSQEIAAIVRDKLSTTTSDINKLSSTKNLRQVLPFQVGFHHAGLLPVLKEIVEDLFGKGLLKVLYATETFAVGINMPAKTVCFDSLKKYDGFGVRFLNTKEYFQMAGRAGRRGIDTHGLVVSMIERRDFDYPKIKKITAKDTEPIRSQFKLGVNTVLNMIKLHTPQEIEVILQQSFLAFQEKRLNRKIDIKTRYLSLCRKLEQMGYLKNGKLTEKGDFASKIYSDEILTTEIFGTSFCLDLNKDEILILIGCLAYEWKEKHQFFQPLKDERTRHIKKKIQQHHHLEKDKRFWNLFEIASLVGPCLKQESFFLLTELTDIPEGDLIRFFGQILDRVRQIRRASFNPDLSIYLDELHNLVLKLLDEVRMI
ncbi:DEAD/DEAH box helicase [Candidatus Woesearchaeota archaeon]|nr:DEAD/DEAH box helicase [Candidatus Woesearchaeota archaeon]